jgi:hypothetical protein
VRAPARKDAAVSTVASPPQGNQDPASGMNGGMVSRGRGLMQLRHTFSKAAEYAAVLLEAAVDIKNILAIVVFGIAVAGSVAADFVKQHADWFIAACVLAALVSLAFIAKALARTRALRRQGPRQEARLKQQACRRELDAELSMYRHASPATRNIKDLEKKHHAYLKSLCHTAAATFDVLKPAMAPFSANIKHIVMADPNETGLLEPCYAQVVGTWADESERGKYNEAAAGKFVPLNSCYWYSLMFNPVVGRDYFAHHDRRELAAYLEKIGFGVADKVEPSFFRSWFGMPIYGQTQQRPGPDRDSPYIYVSRNGKMVVAGILCVDSPKAGAFLQAPGLELAHDVAVMQELTQSAFSSYRSMREIFDDAASPPATSAALALA